MLTGGHVTPLIVNQVENFLIVDNDAGISRKFLTMLRDFFKFFNNRIRFFRLNLVCPYLFLQSGQYAKRGAMLHQRQGGTSKFGYILPWRATPLPSRKTHPRTRSCISSATLISRRNILSAARIAATSCASTCTTSVCPASSQHRVVDRGFTSSVSSGASAR